MLLGVLASCDNGPSSSSTSDRTSGGNVLEEIGLPEDLNFKNQTVRILISDGYEYDTFTRKQLTNDALNDKIYNRTQNINSLLGVKIDYVGSEDPTETANLSIMTGLDEYQILADGAVGVFAAAADNVFLPLGEDTMKYMDLDREWYSQYLRERASVYNRLYAVTGSFSLSLIRKAYATFFNQTVMNEQGITENLYSLVRDGDWTIDKQLEIIKSCYSDATGDGKTMDDAYGLTIDNVCALDAYWSAFDLSLISRTEDGGLAITSDTDKFYKAVEKVYNFMYEDQNVNYVDMVELDPGGTGDAITKLFSEDLSLFVTLNLGNCELKNIRDMKSDYGVLPMPKWDKAQDDYYTFVKDGYVVFAIPKTNKNTDATSAVLEALSYDSYKNVAPTYYDRILKGRYLRDPDSFEMMDKVTKNISLDYAWIHTFALDKLAQATFRDILAAQKKNIASVWRSSTKRYTSKLQDLMAVYQKPEG